MDISIIIPTYRPGTYLKECLQSIAAQSMSKDKFEVIVVLNGEVSPYEDFVKDLLRTYQFNHQLITTEAKGVSHARNLGIDKAQGSYFCFIDDDDLVSANYLDNLFKLAIVNPHAIIASNVKTYKEANAEIGNDYITHSFERWTKKSNCGHPILNLIQGKTFMSSSCCKIISRDMIGDQRFNEKLYIGEDSVFMAVISNRVNKVILTSEDTIYYRRIRQGSASRSNCPLSKRLGIVYNLTKAYCKLLKSGYDKAFILSRIAATQLKIIAIF